MISLRTIRKVIDQSAKDYEKCWELLQSLKDHSSNLSADDLLDFQPKLATAIFRLGDMYQSLSRENNAVISRKKNLTSIWFGHRMRTLSAYKGAISETVKTGRILGDAFAWLFYQRERKYLRKHFEHEPVLNVPSGLGGKGELAFIKNVRVWNGQITIYHGITTFLRIGDVSFYDPNLKRITAIGELKTEKDTGSALGMQVYLLWPRDAEKVWPQSSQPLTASSKTPMPPKRQQQLTRQLKTMADSLDLSKPRDTIKLQDKTHLNELRELANGLLKKSVMYQKAGDGLLLAGFTSNRERSFFGRLWPKTKPQLERRLAGLNQHVHGIMDMTQVGSPFNINSIFYGSLELSAFPGATPIIWWTLPESFVRKLIFHEVTVVTIYNPAHLGRKLRASGFEVELDRVVLKVSKRIRDSKIEMHNMQFFVNLIQHHLIREDFVLNIFAEIVQRIDNGEILPNSRVDLDPHIYY